MSPSLVIPSSIHYMVPITALSRIPFARRQPSLQLWLHVPFFQILAFAERLRRHAAIHPPPRAWVVGAYAWYRVLYRCRTGREHRVIRFRSAAG